MRNIYYLTKFFFLSVLLCMTLFVTSISSAAEISTALMEKYLKNIQDYTYKTLTIVNDFPVYLTNLSTFALNWMKPDDSDSTASMQGNFTTLGSIFASNLAAQTDKDLQLRLTANLLGVTDTSTFSNPTNNPAILATVPTINDITYMTLLGSPPVQKNPGVDPYTVAPFNYILNAGGLNIYHNALPFRPTGKPLDVKNYQTYYNTVNAIQSFNGYVLGGIYAEAKNGGALNAAQTALVQQASQASWFTQIASEELGKVLRQILMFQSQTYVLLAQSIQTQKQLLVAQTMTNSLLIANNQLNEGVMYSRAVGLSP